MPIRIGALTFDSPLFMAPMEGITDVPFRRILREHGCGVTCTQMIHAEGLLKGNGPRLREASFIDPREGAVGFQLCGSEPAVVARAAQEAVRRGAAFIDLNMGCPARHVVKLGAGADLLRDPLRAARMVRSVRAAVAVPVTAKIRAGWDDRYRNAPEVAKLLEGEGLALLSVHARTKEQKHSGPADWDLIREIKANLKIPVVGNGGVRSPDDIARMGRLTGADGVMVARGALGNPWIFGHEAPSPGEIRNALLRHLDLHLSFYPNADSARLTFRKHIVWYTKGLPHSADFRAALFRERSPDLAVPMIERFFDSPAGGFTNRTALGRRDPRPERS